MPTWATNQPWRKEYPRARSERRSNADIPAARESLLVGTTSAVGPLPSFVQPDAGATRKLRHTPVGEKKDEDGSLGNEPALEDVERTLKRGPTGVGTHGPHKSHTHAVGKNRDGHTTCEDTRRPPPCALREVNEGDGKSENRIQEAETAAVLGRPRLSRERTEDRWLPGRRRTPLSARAGRQGVPTKAGMTKKAER